MQKPSFQPYYVKALSSEQAQLPTWFPSGHSEEFQLILRKLFERGFRLMRKLNIQKGNLSNISKNFVLSNPQIHVVMLRRALDGSVIYLARVGSQVQGPSGFMHGGATAALLDDCVSSAVLLSGPFAMTVQLNVQYRKPVPLNSVVVVEGYIDQTNGRKTIAGGKMYHPDGALYAEATLLFVKPRLVEPKM
ncbi:Acyl-coenzyme A thioesterase THEM4 [Galdieria sulphuraria]|uniref:Acyl-coenzyme A thioesterase THEM4 n=1 Tax=Galdieria sulphuraria TaxID=130081 RepID=M2XD16_GALSU|nr:thioesterase family [Galdieria sulphuraria]EME27837.1 thioesterase family [Galdieria sulphuraria]GJD11697.1 Acyl-coenzyme A thioesterase THEM4 [Galdieria sulphuraria]|eukprot:XP_005704357.1 thioesterase family [Galdieria sulphuraria]